MKVLVTGAAGFIGYHVSQSLLQRGDQVVGIDNLNDYYDVKLKEDRLSQLITKDNFEFQKIDLSDRDSMESLFQSHHFDRVINLAAQAGVRYSIENPRAYIDANIVGFINVLECCRHAKVAHLSYASSSSVYGANTKQPFSESDNVDHPVSLYAASKKSNELMAHTYSNLFDLPTTGLRFFTVYGPWGRPDMALFKFTKGILNKQSIDVYNNGEMYRDFTYIDDIVEGVIKITDKIPKPDDTWNGNAPNPASSFAPYRVYNIGNNNPVKLMDFVNAIQDELGEKAMINMMPIQPGDVPATSADTEALTLDIGFKPNTTVETGIKHFINWYKSYYYKQ